MANEEFIPYMGYEWLQIEDDTVTIGISEEGASELTEITAISLPAENDEISADEIMAGFVLKLAGILTP